VRASPLARFLLVAYVLLVVYASLYPLAGWSGEGVSAFAYLTAPWPRYVTAFDVAANVIGYVPYGFLCVMALYPRSRGAYALLAAALSGLALSVGMETAQSFLPTRVASNLDVLCNLAGTASGAALGAPLAGWLLHLGPVRRLRALAFLPGATADVGLVLLGLWLFAQLDPATLLFGVGDLRDLVHTPAGHGYAPAIFVSVEAVVTGANLAAVCLLASAITAPGASARPTLIGLIGAALAVKTLAFAILMRAEHVLAWLTPGAERGLVAGLALALVAVGLPRTARLALSAMLMMAATVLVNLAPENPYFADTLRVWNQGHFLNFDGLTRVVAGAWPFAALGYLIYLAARRSREPLG
jgi:VanZ family protein